MDASLEPVSVESNGRILSGVGVSEDSLLDTMEAREPAPVEKAEPEKPPVGEPAPAPAATETPAQAAERARDDSGKFTGQTRGQKRFDQLTREREEAAKRASDAEQRAKDLEARLQAMEQAQRQPAPQERPQPPQAKPQTPTAPKIAEFIAQIGTQYQTYEDALEAYTDARDVFRQQEFDARIRQSIEADRASRDFRTHVSTVFEQGRKSFPDFDAVVARSRVVFPDAIRYRIAQAPNADALMYALCKDDTLAARIAQMRDPVQIGWELARVVPPAAVASPASTVPAVSTAPAPYQPVGSGSKTTQPSLDELAMNGGDDYDKSGYRERRRAERLARR
jgi:hypothetical protein